MKNQLLIDSLQRKQESDQIVKEILKNNSGKEAKRWSKYVLYYANNLRLTWILNI